MNKQNKEYTKSNSRLLFGLIITGFLIVCCSTTDPKYNSIPEGTGTEDDPYQIATFEHLVWIDTIDTTTGLYFIQIQDIDASETAETASEEDNLIGQFKGFYDGQDHLIDNYSGQEGLFGSINSAIVENLGLTNINVIGSYIGGFADTNNNNSIIRNCYTTGFVSGTHQQTGGLVSSNSASIIDGYSLCVVEGVEEVGGLAGKNRTNGNLFYSRFFGSVIGEDKIGGIVGLSDENSVIDGCYLAGSVNGIENVGGLVGYMSTYSALLNCYSNGTVSGDIHCGGLVGRTRPGSAISNCYNRSVVSGSVSTGGLVGWHDSALLRYCYNIGSVSGSGLSGGLIAMNTSAEVIASFWNTQTTGQPYSAGGTGKTTNEMKTLSIYLDADWDFEGESENGTDEYWIMDDNNSGYPYLWFVPLVEK